MFSYWCTFFVPFFGNILQKKTLFYCNSYYRKYCKNLSVILFKQLVMEYSNSTGGNEAYKNWYSPPAPVFMQYYVFNYTNVDEIVHSKARPNVTQLGPYSYRCVYWLVITFLIWNTCVIKIIILTFWHSLLTTLLIKTGQLPNG